MYRVAPMKTLPRVTRLARGLGAPAGSSPPPPPPGLPPPPSGSLAFGLKHLRGDDRAPAHRSPIWMIMSSMMFFGLAGGAGWALAQPAETVEQLGEAWSEASGFVKSLLPGAKDK